MNKYRHIGLAFIIYCVTTGYYGYAQKTEKQSWNLPVSAAEIGEKLLNRFIASAHTNFGSPTPPSSITYSEVCAWYGAIKFAEQSHDTVALRLLYARLQLLLSQEARLIPKADHVDHNIFGIIPLEFYRFYRDTALRTLGTRFADLQWDSTNLHRPDEIALARNGYSWQSRFWIDDMFMINVLQAKAYKTTGNQMYVSRAAREMAEYLRRLQMPIGLFYHALDVPFFWGRGNGWMAAGMTEILLVLPVSDTARPVILASYQKMMASLKQYQSSNGMWRQLIDDSSAWPETSCTAMFTYAMVEGIKHGWLDAPQYNPVVEKSWGSLVGYVDSNGDVREICEGTNKLNDRNYYLQRKRITGDMHGQAPVLWCAAALLTSKF
jgi:unsaturated rhamnogalacturonyl hydrolase